MNNKKNQNTIKVVYKIYQIQHQTFQTNLHKHKKLH
jgi:hypothetical protein